MNKSNNNSPGRGRMKLPQGALRKLAAKVKTAKGRKSSSTRWLQRQLNDPYVDAARRQGYRSRAAFKLTEIDDRFGLLKHGVKVLDLGAAPGGWTQVAVERAGAGNVVAVDLLPMDTVPGAQSLAFDFLDPDAPARIGEALGGKVDVLLSDMAAPSTGHRRTDHLRIVGLAEAVIQFADEVLAPGGALCCKVFQGGTERDLLAVLRRSFHAVHHVKPKASRSESAELYVVSTGFRGTR